MSTNDQKPPMRKIMAYLDGELSSKEAAEVRDLLDRHPEWSEQFRDLEDVVCAASSLKVKIAPKTWDNYWEEIDHRLPHHFGWAIALIGSLLLMLYGFYKVVMYAENDFVRLGIFFVGVGIITLFFTVLRGRYLELPKDRYRKIRR